MLNDVRYFLNNAKMFAINISMEFPCRVPLTLTSWDPHTVFGIVVARCNSGGYSGGWYSAGGRYGGGRYSSRWCNNGWNSGDGYSGHSLSQIKKHSIFTVGSERAIFTMADGQCSGCVTVNKDIHCTLTVKAKG